MEVVEGETLEARVRRDGPLNAKSALEIAIQITRALMAAAAHGLIHRDLKPGNIMLTPSNAAPTELEVKVIDFGLAKAIADAGGETDLTHGGFVGTPTFASPEQFRSGPVDARSDIYSPGATLWFALTGLPPRTGNTIEEIRDRQTRADLPVQQLIARKVPEPIIKLLRSTLSVDPAKRPASARELMETLESCRRKLSHGIGSFYKVAALILVSAIAMSGYFMLRINRQPAPTSANNIASSASGLPIPTKSIAVLPFENLSAHPENAFFTDGVQDEILNDLAKIADLKVISRTSVMQYKTGVKRNVREIANALGVAHVVEGSVQRVANRVRVSAQLIDARTDTHVWAEHYDRPIDDVFVIQSQIAKTIADQLKAKLSATEKSAIEERPTKDLAAYDLYVRAEKLFLLTPDAVAFENVHQAIRLLDQAVAHDPTFLLAYCLLSRIHAYLYFVGFDHTPARVALAKEARDAALRLGPDRGEPHLAAAYVAYWCYRNYETALTEVDIARRKLPNDTAVFEITSLIARRQGDWEQCKRNLERTVELDPRSVSLLQGAADTYQELRRYPEAVAAWDRALAITPGAVTLRVRRAEVDLDSRADAQPMQEVIQSIVTAD